MRVMPCEMCENGEPCIHCWQYRAQLAEAQLRAIRYQATADETSYLRGYVLGMVAREAINPESLA